MHSLHSNWIQTGGVGGSYRMLTANRHHFWVQIFWISQPSWSEYVPLIIRASISPTSIHSLSKCGHHILWWHSNSSAQSMRTCSYMNTSNLGCMDCLCIIMKLIARPPQPGLQIISLLLRSKSLGVPCLNCDLIRTSQCHLDWASRDL